MCSILHVQGLISSCEIDCIVKKDVCRVGAADSVGGFPEY